MTVTTAPLHRPAPAQGFRLPRLAAPLLAGACVTLVAVAVVLRAVGPEALASGDVVRGAVAGLAFGGLGGLVAHQRPSSPMGWVMLAVGVSGAATLAAAEYGHRAVVLDPGGLPLGPEAVWLSSWVWAPGYLLVPTLLLLLFPAGRLPSPRWRPVLHLTGAALALGTLGWALTPYDRRDQPLPPEYGELTNPLAVPGAEVLLTIALPLFLACAAASLASLVVRARSAEGPEREQLLWVLLAAVLVVALLVAALALDGESPLLVALAPLPLPVALGIAVLRHGLWDVELILSRSLAYAGLTLAVLGAYAALLAVTGSLLGRREQGPDLLLFIVAALLAQPLRDVLQQAANRAVYGDRDDPAAAVARLGERLESATSAAQVLPGAVQTVARTLRLPYAAVEMPGHARVAHGNPAGRAIAVPLVHQGREVGTLHVTAGGQHLLDERQQRLLDQLARHVALAAHAVALQQELSRSREQLVASREEERRRLRHDLHDDLGPVLAALAMQLEAARELVDRDPDFARRTLDSAGDRLRACVADIRRIVDDLRPPSLDGLGLVAALREQAERYAGTGLEVEVTGDDLGDLPAAVDVAAYRIASEALTNAARHSGASRAEVGVRRDGRHLEVRVADDGAGVAPTARAGVGLASMHARASELGGTCSLTSGDRGTVVLARLPLDLP